MITITYAEDIEKELNKNGETTLEMIQKELKVEFQDIKEPIATLLRNGKIRISGFENYKSKKDKDGNVNLEPRKVLTLKHLKFERQYPHTTFDIQLQFRKMESDSIGYEEASKYLLNRFDYKFKEYQKWENEILEKMKKNSVYISVKKLNEEMERIIENNLDIDTDSTIDENVKEYLLRFVLYGHINQNKTKLKEFKKNEKEWKKKHNFTHYCYIKLENLPTILPPGFPNDLSGYKYVEYNGKIDPETYLFQWKINTLPKGFIMIEDAFMELLFYLNNLQNSMMKYSFIKCLSEPKNKDDRIRSLKTFGEFLKKLEIIKPNFMEKMNRDKNGKKLKDNDEIEEFASFLVKKITNEFINYKEDFN